MKKYCERYKITRVKVFVVVICIIVFFVVAVGVPYWLNIYIINNDAYSKSSADGWASFFGSFLGGVIGGGATLIAVLATISHNNRELDRQDKKTQDEKVRKSATIVYYDFRFAFDDIIAFREAFPKYTGTGFEINDGITVKYFGQFYFNADWIKTVAELVVCKNFSYEDIKYIYEIYGNLFTIKKLIENNNEEAQVGALSKMDELVTIDRELTKEVEGHFVVKYKLQSKVETLMKQLSETAKRNSELLIVDKTV